MSEITPGAWIVYRVASTYNQHRHAAAQVEKVTAKQIRIMSSTYYGRILQPECVRAVFPNKDDAHNLLASIDGAIGECKNRVNSANEACRSAISRLIEKAKANAV